MKLSLLPLGRLRATQLDKLGKATFPSSLLLCRLIGGTASFLLARLHFSAVSVSS